MGLAAASAYYIILFILFSLADLFLAAQSYLLYLILNFMGCIFVTICVIADSGLGYLMVASPFGLFTTKVNNFCKKAFCSAYR
jgi:hypothetical protein